VRTIGVITGARSDYGLLTPVMRAIQADKQLKLRLFVTGMHLSPEFGMTVDAIEADGFEITARIESLVSSDTPQGIAKSMGLGLLGFSQAFGQHRPDIVVVLGDRFETLAAVSAALPFAIPVAHISGGETTEGVIDECIRHAITKMSHLHFVAHEVYRQHVIQMGEEPWRVEVTGEPGLENLTHHAPLSDAKLEKLLGAKLAPGTLLVTFHPVTLELGATKRQVTALMQALEELNRPVVFTYPNADTESRGIVWAIEEYRQAHTNAVAVRSLGTQAYYTLMRRVAAMVGNSSSGIVEAASFELPVVDIGERQRGRIRGRNVIHSQPQADAIVAAVRASLKPEFRAGLKGISNPYGDGTAAARIVRTLKRVKLDRRLMVKRFYSTEAAFSAEKP